MRKILLTVTALGVLSITGLWLVGDSLSAPVTSRVGAPPANRTVEIIDSQHVHGWYFPAREHKACVLLLHGKSSDRRSMLNRTGFLVNNGYSSLVIDLQAHGESPGNRITFGYREANSAHTAVSFLRKIKHCPKIVSLGSSLGGAASLLGKKPLPADAYILEAVYSNIKQATRNRLMLRLGTAGEFLAPLLYWQIPLRFEFSTADLSPQQAIKAIKSPVLIMNGSHDLRTTLNDAKLLYNNAPTAKVFIEINGARHEDLYQFNPSLYQHSVLKFLTTYL